MVDVKGNAGTRQVGLQNFGAQVKEAAKDSTLSPAEERQLKESFKALSADDKRAAIELVKASNVPGLAAHLGEEPAGHVFGTNKASVPLKTEPGVITDDAWSDPGRNIVGKLTQNPAPGTPGEASGKSRCAPSNLLAGALMNGREPAARLLENVAGGGTTALSDKERTRLREIAGHVRGPGQTSMQELGEAQDLLYRAGNVAQGVKEAATLAATGKLSKAEQKEMASLATRLDDGPADQASAARMGALLTKANGVKTEVVNMGRGSNVDWQVRLTPELMNAGKGGAFLDAEVALLAKQGANGKVTERRLDSAFNDAGELASIQGVLKDLKPGQSAVFRVSTDPNVSRATHFISVGRGTDGAPYVYNPDPARGQHTLVTGNPGATQPAELQKELQRYEGLVFTESNGDAVGVTIRDNR